MTQTDTQARDLERIARTLTDTWVDGDADNYPLPILQKLIVNALQEYGAACAERERSECAETVRQLAYNADEDGDIRARSALDFAADAILERARANPPGDGGEG